MWDKYNIDYPRHNSIDGVCDHAATTSGLSTAVAGPSPWSWNNVTMNCTRKPDNEGECVVPEVWRKTTGLPSLYCNFVRPTVWAGWYQNLYWMLCGLGEECYKPDQVWTRIHGSGVYDDDVLNIPRSTGTDRVWDLCCDKGLDDRQECSKWRIVIRIGTFHHFSWHIRRVGLIQ